MAAADAADCMAIAVNDGDSTLQLTAEPQQPLAQVHAVWAPSSLLVSEPRLEWHLHAKL